MGLVVKVGDNAYTAIIYNHNELYAGRKLRLSKQTAENYFSPEKIKAKLVRGFVIVNPLDGLRVGTELEDAAAEITEAKIISTNNIVETITVGFKTLDTPMGDVIHQLVGIDCAVNFTGLYSAAFPPEGCDLHMVLNISGLIFKPSKNRITA